MTLRHEGDLEGGYAWERDGKSQFKIQTWVGSWTAKCERLRWTFLWKSDDNCLRKFSFLSRSGLSDHRIAPLSPAGGVRWWKVLALATFDTHLVTRCELWRWSRQIRRRFVYKWLKFIGRRRGLGRCCDSLDESQWSWKSVVIKRWNLMTWIEFQQQIRTWENQFPGNWKIKLRARALSSQHKHTHSSPVRK